MSAPDPFRGGRPDPTHFKLSWQHRIAMTVGAALWAALIAAVLSVI